MVFIQWNCQWASLAGVVKVPHPSGSYRSFNGRGHHASAVTCHNRAQELVCGHELGSYAPIEIFRALIMYKVVIE